MSTIKSSAENLTLNADGANNDIKFQSNGSEVASIDQAGTVTATSFAGSGANLTGLSSFNPDGAVTINESGADVDFRVESDTLTHALFVDGGNNRVGIGGTPTNFLSLFPTEQSSIRKIDFGLYNGGTDNTFVQTAHHSSNGNVREIGLEGSIVNFYTGADSGTSTSKRLSITADGRGLSPFTAKAWAYWDGTGTLDIRAAHNISSVSDYGTGWYAPTYANAMAGLNYGVYASGSFNNANRSRSVSGRVQNAGSAEVFSQADNTAIDNADCYVLIFSEST